MAQASSSNPNSLPGIVTDQPEIFESEPALSDDTGVNDLDLINEQSDDGIALIEVPIQQAFSYFAERENEIAKFYVQRHGEYKLCGNKPEEETDIEKYHRLVSEVNELLNKFQAIRNEKSGASDMDAIGSLNTKAITSNLDVLSRQLKSLEFAAEDGSLDATQSGFLDIKSKLNKLFDKKTEICDDKDHKQDTDNSNIIRMSALETRLNMLETLLGHDETKTQSLFKITKSDNLTDAAETLSSWLSLLRPDSIQRVSREIDYLSQRMEKLGDQGPESDGNKMNPQSRSRLDELCSLVTSADKFRAMVPTIIHRLNAMEELQQRAAQVATTVNHLEQIQAQIVDNLQANKDELGSLKEMFSKNIDLIKEYSADIDSRIASVRERDD